MLALQTRFRASLMGFASLSVLRDIFHALDPLQTGTVLFAEFTRALKRDTNIQLSRGEELLIKEHFNIQGAENHIDVGKLYDFVLLSENDLDQLASTLGFAIQRMNRTGVNLLELFEMFDTNMDATVSLPDFRHVILHESKLPVDELALQTLCERFGKDGGSARILYAEFLSFATANLWHVPKVRQFIDPFRPSYHSPPAHS